MASVSLSLSLPFRSAMSLSRSALTSVSSRVCPSGARTTTVPVGASRESSPPKISMTLSLVSSDSSPGMVIDSEVFFIRPAAAEPAPMRMRIQTAMNRHR